MTDVAAAEAKSPRIESVDSLRGLVIVIMALDHVRDYTSIVRFDPLDPEQTNWALYLTRWITHFCAPVFVFLAGTAAGFQRHKGKSAGALSWFLLTRGLWLIVLELTVVALGWTFEFQPGGFLQVIWAIGVSMVVLAALVHLPLALIAAFGAVLVFGHNIFPPTSFGGFDAPETDPANIVAMLLHQSGLAQIGPATLFIAYPLIPWIGVMALGYVFADLYRLDATARRSLLLRSGVAVTAAFFALRGLNLYGDPGPWSEHGSAGRTIMSFFNTTKYPPSLSFLLMTLGPALIVLSLAERWKGPLHDFFVVFGRVPLFFYILHIYLAHAVAVGLGMTQGFEAKSLMTFFAFFPESYGVGLAGVYLIWTAVVAALYLPCRWFGAAKSRSKSWWMAYF